MVKLYEILGEKIKVWHSDDFGITNLNKELMVKDQSKNKEGPGIYFTTNSEVRYGKYPVSAEVNPSRFIDARSRVSTINKRKLLEFLKALQKNDSEEFYFYISDYVEVESEEDVDDRVLQSFIREVGNSELRNFQLELAAVFGVTFVELWVKILDTDGNFLKYNSNEDWYIIMNPEIKVTKENSRH